MQEQIIPTNPEDAEAQVPVIPETDVIQGINATIQIGTTTTGEPGTDASVENVGTPTHAVLNFTIPRGSKGETGESATIEVEVEAQQLPSGSTPTASIVNSGDTHNADYKLTIGIPKGDTGESATIQMTATATTLSAGSQATATITNSGDSHNANYTLALGIPRGADGHDGADGQSATIKVGTVTVTTLAEGSQATATVSNVGTSRDGEFDFTFGIPEGKKGETGPRGSVKSQYVAELPASGDEDTFYLVDRDLESHTESGEYITLETTQTAAAIQSAQIDGNATQTGTPTPDAPQPISVLTGENVVKVIRKNLWSTDNAQSFVTAINNSTQANLVTKDGKSCIFFQPSAGYNSYATKNFTLGLKFEENTVYTVSFDEFSTASNRHIAVYYTDGTYRTVGAPYPSADQWNHLTITTDANKSVAYIAPFYTSGDTYIDINTFMVEKSGSPSSYEPYQEQDYEVNLGKNLYIGSPSFDGYAQASSWVEDGTYDGLPVYKRSGAWSGAYKEINVEAGNYYTFSAYIKSDEERTVGIYHQGGTATTSSLAKTFTTTTSWAKYSNTIYCTGSGTMRFRVENATNIANSYTYVAGYQLELGSKATSLAPYFTPTELAKIGTYQDRIYKDGEKWYVEKQVGKVSANLTGIYDLAGGLKGGVCGVSPAKNQSVSDSICDRATRVNVADIYPGSYYANPLNFMFVGTADDTLATLQTKYNGATLYYVLATPTTTEITNQTLIDQLEALASATLNQGVNNIFTEIATGNAMPTLELNWVEWEKYNRHNVYIWNDDIDDWQVIVGAGA